MPVPRRYLIQLGNYSHATVSWKDLKQQLWSTSKTSKATKHMDKAGEKQALYSKKIEKFVKNKKTMKTEKELKYF